MSELVLSYADYGKPQETGTVRLKGTALTGATFAAVDAMMTTLANAIDGITLGVRTKTEKKASVVEVAPTQPASQFAQREVKWLIKWHDEDGAKYSGEIPCADLALLDPDGNERADMTNAAITAFVAAFQTYVKGGPDLDKAVTVDDIIFVSRNL